MQSVDDALCNQLSRDQSESTDELSLFGNMMVKKLRRVKSEQSQDKLQEEILSLVNSVIYNEGVDNSFYNSTWTQLTMNNRCLLKNELDIKYKENIKAEIRLRNYLHL